MVSDRIPPHRRRCPRRGGRTADHDDRMPPVSRLRSCIRSTSPARRRRVVALLAGAGLLAGAAVGSEAPPATAPPVSIPDRSSGLPSPPEAATAPATVPAPVGADAAAVSLLRRPVLIGASMTQGFNAAVTRERDGRRLRVTVTIGDLLEQARVVEGDEIVTHSDLMFFSRPERTGPLLVHRAIGEAPTVVVALDFLFWYGYGELPEAGADPGANADASPSERRLARLERGLRVLDRVECPILVGDLPDMHEAIGLMLSRRQVPDRDTLARLNERIRAWAEERDRVTLVPLADLAERMRRGEALEIAGFTWSAEDARRLLQLDRLHPSGLGLSVVTQQLIASLIEHVPGVEAADLRTDAAAVLEGHVVARIGPADATGPEDRRKEDEAPAPTGTGTSDSGGTGAGTGAGCGGRCGRPAVTPPAWGVPSGTGVSDDGRGACRGLRPMRADGFGRPGRFAIDADRHETRLRRPATGEDAATGRRSARFAPSVSDEA